MGCNLYWRETILLLCLSHERTKHLRQGQERGVILSPSIMKSVIKLGCMYELYNSALYTYISLITFPETEWWDLNEALLFSKQTKWTHVFLNQMKSLKSNSTSPGGTSVPVVVPRNNNFASFIVSIDSTNYNWSKSVMTSSICKCLSVDIFLGQTFPASVD